MLGLLAHLHCYNDLVSKADSILWLHVTVHKCTAASRAGLLGLLAHLLASQTPVPLVGLQRSYRSDPCCREAEPMLLGQLP